MPGFATNALHAGYKPDATGSRQVPIYANTSYQFRDADHAARLFGLQEFGNIYTRIMNPTTGVLEERLAALEGGKAALATSSGHAAQFLAITTIAQAGDNIVASPNLYGGTWNQFAVTLPRLGITARFTGRDATAADYARLTDANTRAWYIESIGNPGLNIPDVEAIAAAAKKAGVALIVDNTFGMGGAVFQPLKWGADIVTHSCTKWIGGHGAAIGGAIVDGGTAPWGNGRYPLITQPQPGYHGLELHKAFPELAFILKARVDGLRDQGQCLGPMEAWVILLGIETLSLRAARHTASALAIAEWLKAQPQVAWVNYPGLKDHPDHARALKYFGGRPGGVLTFGVKSGHEGGKRFINALKLVSHLANVGDSRTLAIHPASTTHSQLDAAKQKAAGVAPEMVRLSIGLEDLDDIQADLAQALKA